MITRCRHLETQPDPVFVAGRLELRPDVSATDEPALAMDLCGSCWRLTCRFVRGELSPPTAEKEGL